LSIKTRLIGGTSALVLAGSMLAFAAPAAHAAVLSVGGCDNLLALGTAKSTTVGDGITDKDNQDVSLSTKGVDPNVNKGPNLGACGFNGGLSTPDASKPPVKGFSGIKSVSKWGTKLFSVESDCNVNDTSDNTEWPLSGSLSITFSTTSDLTTAGKPQALTAQVTVDGFTDPDNNPGTPSDVVSFHGIVIKGVAAGSDLAGETEFDPTVKDKTQTTNNPYFGYQYDLGNAGGCADTTPANANITAFNNGSVGGQSQLLGLPVSGLDFTIGS
jgi:hypothetical protein